MRVRCAPEAGTQAHQSFTFRPADPAWAPIALVERCRTALKAYDAYLDLWWSPMRGFGGFAPGRWRVVQWLKLSGTWDTVFYWEGLKGEYREPSPDALVNKIRACDLWARDDDLGKAAKRLADENDKREEKEKRTRYDEAFDHAHDIGIRAEGPGANRGAYTTKVLGHGVTLEPEKKLILP